MLYSHILADTVNLLHLTGMTLVSSMPLLPFIEDAFPEIDKLPPKTYIYLSIPQLLVLISYKFKDDICLLSEVEHYLNPTKYEIYTIEKSTKNGLIYAFLSTLAPVFFHKRRHRYLIFGSYYAYIIYSLIKTLI
ncbi:hypothetical protein CPAV1605_510 [seawater metagenome]|uniref:Uncharacterized protein n=1 Tax=seawater metagenome TaxID=1561972 RepID=A0A5E8CLD3_9ZZZZ